MLLYPCMFCVALLMFCVFAILLLNVMFCVYFCMSECISSLSSFNNSLDGGDCLYGGHYADDLAAN